MSLLSDVTHNTYIEKLKNARTAREFADLFRSGVLLSLMLNSAKDGSVPEGGINWKVDPDCLRSSISKRDTESALNPEQTKTLFFATENLNKFIACAKEAKIIVVNISAEDILGANLDLILGLTWQIIRLAMFKEVNLLHHPELIRLMEPGEDVIKFISIADEELLIRWTNWHLAASLSLRRVKFLSRDELKDGVVLLQVFNHVVPEYASEEAHALVSRALGNNAATDVQRIDAYVKACRLINCRMIFNTEDLLYSDQRSYALSLAVLFNKHTGIHLPSEEEMRALLRNKHELERKNSELEASLEEMRNKFKIVSQSCEDTMNSLSNLKLTHSEFELAMREEEKKLISALEEKEMRYTDIEELLKEKVMEYETVNSKVLEELSHLKHKAKECYRSIYYPGLSGKVVSVLSRSQLSMNFNKSNPISPRTHTPTETPIGSPDKSLAEDDVTSTESDVDSNMKSTEKCSKYIDSVDTLISQITDVTKEHEKNLSIMLERLEKLSSINDLMAKKICEYTESRMRERKK